MLHISVATLCLHVLSIIAEVFISGTVLCKYCILFHSTPCHIKVMFGVNHEIKHIIVNHVKACLEINVLLCVVANLGNANRTRSQCWIDCVD